MLSRAALSINNKRSVAPYAASCKEVLRITLKKEDAISPR